MTLPIVEAPSYELTLPSRNEVVKYRPFLVKEEKILLVALEDGTQQAMIRAIKDICYSCTYEKLPVDELPLFDLEFVFLNIRAKSVGEVAKLRILCPDDRKTYANIEVDLTKVDVLVDDNHTNDIIIDKDKKLGIIMKYPNLEDLNDIGDFTAATSKELFDIIAKGIDYVYEGETKYKGKDYSTEEMNKFLENLTGNVLNEIKKFYDTSPKLKHTVEVENPETKVKSKVTLQGLMDFFG